MTTPRGTCSRRNWLAATAGGLVVLAVPVTARADALALVLSENYGDAPIATGRVSVSLPALAENGNSVALGIEVDSPMTAEDHVVSIDVFAPDNPIPHIARFHLTPQSGRAAVRTRMRLAGSQPVAAVARMSNGALYAGSAEIVVTEAACLDFLI